MPRVRKFWCNDDEMCVWLNFIKDRKNLLMQLETTYGTVHLRHLHIDTFVTARLLCQFTLSLEHVQPKEHR